MRHRPTTRPAGCWPVSSSAGASSLRGRPSSSPVAPAAGTTTTAPWSSSSRAAPSTIPTRTACRSPIDAAGCSENPAARTIPMSPAIVGPLRSPVRALSQPRGQSARTQRAPAGVRRLSRPRRSKRLGATSAQVRLRSSDNAGKCDQRGLGRIRPAISLRASRRRAASTRRRTGHNRRLPRREPGRRPPARQHWHPHRG